MKAIRVHQHGNADVLQLEDVPTPTPRPGEALIKQKAAGLNFIDIYIRRGEYRIHTALPYIPGMEGSGIVEKIGEGVTEVKPGDRVAYAGNIGAYAEYNVVKASHLIPLPDDIDFLLGAAFPLQCITAHYLLHEYHHIKPGDDVLVHAAAGGMGLLLVRWLKKLGARVIGTVSTEEKANNAKEAGADDIIFYKTQDFVTEVKRLTKQKGADYIIDGVGKSTFTKDLEAVKTRGCICLFGMASGPADPMQPNLLQTRSITVAGGNLMNYFTPRDEFLNRVKEVLKGIREGWLKVQYHSFPLAQAKAAQEALEERKSIGKLILTI